MSELNVGLKVSYNGQAVTAGTTKNAEDIKKFQQAIGAQSDASRAAAAQNGALVTSQTRVATQTQNTATQTQQLSTTTVGLSRAAAQSAAQTNQLTSSTAGLTKGATQASAAVKQKSVWIKDTGASARAAAVQNTQLAATQQKVAQWSKQSATALKTSSAATKSQGAASARASAQNRILSASFVSLTGAIAAYTGAQGAIVFTKAVAASELLDIRIKNLTTSYEQNAEVQAFLATQADVLNVRYSTLADGFGKFLALQKAGVQSGEESKALLIGLSNAAKELGASNESVARSIYGYSQAATQGTVQSTELLQVTEAMPGLLNAMDKAAGLAAGGFKRLTADGKVTSAFFKEILIEALNQYAGAAAASSETINAAGQDFFTTFDLVAKKLQEPVNAAVVPVINAAADGLTLLGDNIDVLGTAADGVVLLSAVIGGRLVASLATSTASKIADIAATNAKLIAEKRAAVAALEVAKAEQVAAAAMFSSAQSIRTKTALAVQASAASNTLAAATLRSAAASRAASASHRILGGSMALLGGPVGVITMAAIAIGYFALSANDAEVPTSDLTVKVNELTTGYNELSQAQLKLRGVRVEEQLESVTDSITSSQQAIKELKEELSGGRQIANNSFTGLVKVPLQQEEIKAQNDEIIVQEAKLEQLQEAQNKLLETQEAIKARIASGVKPVTTVKPEQGGSDNGDGKLAKQLASVEAHQRTVTQRVEFAYQNRQTIVDNAFAAGLISEEKRNERSLLLELEKDNAISELQKKQIQEQERLAVQSDEAEMVRLRKHHEDQLAEIQGFKDREALIKFQGEQKILDAVNDERIRKANGFDSIEQEQEHSRQEGLLDATARRTGAVRKLLFSEAEWERKNAAEKTDSVLAIGEFGFKQAAGQSKKAFAMYKAFSIAKAVMNTYEMATGAFNALAPIPVVGPVLGAAAAAAAVAFGLNQVNTIKSQQYSAAYHGGRDYIPSEQTALLQKGERVVSPKQNVALTAATDKILAGESGGGNTYNTFHNQFNLSSEDGDQAQNANFIADILYRQIESKMVNQLRTGSGALYQAVKAA